MRVSSVACGSESCTLAFDFESYADAKESMRSIAFQAFQRHYGFDVLFPEPEDPAAPYAGEVVTGRPPTAPGG